MCLRFSFCDLQAQFAIKLEGAVPDADVIIIVSSLCLFTFLLFMLLLATYLRLMRIMNKDKDYVIAEDSEED